ncbi:pro-resilin-like [Tigriopus californicus]|uniref:pro-resilin-like n=1 Tax=Tigriopus californicus TaxID=6832 RepID=UPI0027DA038A|nr:pro-resilin-like [Tigriopus californicus]
MKTFITLLALVAIALADNAPYRPAPYSPAPTYKEEPAAYQYQYAVADDYAGVNFAQNEARDGYATNGEYRVALPDGRTQIVTYNVADAYSGYVADVRYEGEPKYESYKPAPAPYKPAPYKPTPSYSA